MKKNKLNDEEKLELLTSIFDDSNQMMQVSDLESFTMLYANKPAQVYARHTDCSYEGEKCYKYMMGLDKQCPFCPMLQMGDADCRESEVDNGNEIYAVKTKIIELNGRKAFVEYAWDITKLRRSQKIFESHMKTLINSIPDAQGIFHLDVTQDICLSINGISKNAQNMTQRSTIDKTIQAIASFVPKEEERQELFDFFCREALIENYEMGNVQISKETESYFDDRSIRSVKVTARLLMNPTTNHLECVIYGMDISEEVRERQEYQRHMQEQLAIFHAFSKDYLNIFLVDAKHDKAKILKLDGYVTSGLDKNQDIEYPYYSVCQKYIKERVHPDDQELMREAMRPERVSEELKNKEEYVGSYKILVDGEKHYFQYKYMRLEETGQIMAGFQNIDAIIMKEREQQEVLAKALKAAEHSNRAKTTFLNSMSHDIRTPLNAIIGFTALAESHADDPDAVKAYLSKINVSGNHLLSLINDVLDMSHIESGMVQLEEVPVNLKELISDLCTIVQTSVASKQIELQTQINHMVHENVEADKLRLNQVLLNILSNAMKFTEAGGRILFEVTELPEEKDGYVRYKFRIRDTGIGMSEEFKEHIFEAFSREQTSTISGIQGTGLGMSIAKNLIELMGGNIKVESELGKGTEFTVSVELRCCDQIEKKAEMNTDKQQFKGKKILLVEDNELNREIAVELLTQEGFIMDTAADGLEAVERLRNADPGQYDLVLMDIQMPVMDGYEAARQIRELDNLWAAELPIIAMTANAFEEDRKKALEAGMNEHVAKPIDVEKLLGVLAEIMGNSRESVKQ